MIPFFGLIAGIVAVALLWGDHRGLAWVAVGLIVVQTIAGRKVLDETRKDRPAGPWPFLGVLTIPINISLVIYALFA